MNQSLLASYVKKILLANVYDVSVRTPMTFAEKASHHLQNQIFLKREDQQPVFSFKIRGAYNKISNLSENQLSRGVITASAGNHAQGVAFSARYLGIKATIVMPVTTPMIKVDAVKRLGGYVQLLGDTFNEAYDFSVQLAKTEQLTYIHPYDDPDTIAGQGTIAVEVLQQTPKPLDYIFVPVGGGGLIAGIAAYIKYLQPDIKIIGVEPDDAACLKLAMVEGKPIKLDHVGLFADGVAVSEIGQHTFEVAKDCVDDVITVTSDEICSALRDMFEDTRVLFEPAGALALAGIKKMTKTHQLVDQNMVAIACGANVNFDRLRYIAERAEIGEHKEIVLGVTIPEKEGSFKRFCQCLSGYNFTEFNYRYRSHKDDQQTDAQVFVGINVSDYQQELPIILKRLTEASYQTVDLTRDELAKLHVRYMVGGRSEHSNNELLYRIEFPERPGALFKFLSLLNNDWNISLFHYRNHGAAMGRVLVGLQSKALPIDEGKSQLEKLLGEADYYFHEETHNQAYQLFLK